jgi:molybdopterin biosynthesis enzyme
MSYDYNPQTVSLKIDQYYKRKSSERTSLIPGRIQKSYVSPIVYNGSAHILSLIGANGVIVIPKGVKSVEKGDYVQMILLNL